jgi:hypothetical protein
VCVCWLVWVVRGLGRGTVGSWDLNVKAKTAEFLEESTVQMFMILD